MKQLKMINQFIVVEFILVANKTIKSQWLKSEKRHAYYFDYYLNATRMLMFRKTEMIHILLIIPEDSGPHINILLWGSQVVTMSLTPVLQPISQLWETRKWHVIK